MYSILFSLPTRNHYRPPAVDPVFLHGKPMSSGMYDQLIVLLSEAYRFPIIDPDRRGFSSSE